MQRNSSTSMRTGTRIKPVQGLPMIFASRMPLTTPQTGPAATKIVLAAESFARPNNKQRIGGSKNSAQNRSQSLLVLFVVAADDNAAWQCGHSATPAASCDDKLAEQCGQTLVG